jgi:hypothetical protein
LKYGNVRHWILANSVRVDVLSIIQITSERIDILGNVAIREDVTALGNDDAASRGPSLRHVSVKWAQSNCLDPHDGWENSREHLAFSGRVSSITGRRQWGRGKDDACEKEDPTPNNSENLQARLPLTSGSGGVGHSRQH